MKNCCKLKRLVLDFKNQRGFATLEIICVLIIISVLTTVAVPKMARMVDSAMLDYEMKIFLSDLDFAKALNKNAYYNSGIFDDSNFNDTPHQIFIDVNKNSYDFRRDIKVFASHKLPNGFSYELRYLKPSIDFFKGNRGHIIITSKLNNKRYMIRDTVGRWHGDINPPK